MMRVKWKKVEAIPHLMDQLRTLNAAIEKERKLGDFPTTVRGGFILPHASERRYSVACQRYHLRTYAPYVAQLPGNFRRSKRLGNVFESIWQVCHSTNCYP
jgi:hypothetical protein